MRLGLSADDVLTTTRSVRKRLDWDRPVERDVVEECIEIALQAPTGSFAQGWHWMVVEDAELKRRIADAYGRHFDAYANRTDRPSYGPSDVRTIRLGAIRASATYLRENLHRAPYLVIPCSLGRMEGADSFTQASYWGSILPAVWSFMLALRERGLGSAWTTLHLPDEREVADLLGIPYDRVTQAGLFPVAYTQGTDFKPALRIPARELIHWDRW
jgi:nitroreductase